jgi:2-octaprenyl-6-methoxyphenol hydroxylase
VQAWPTGATPITSIHISQKGGPGRTVISASSSDCPRSATRFSLGDLQAALDARLDAASIPVHRGESCEEISLAQDAARVRFSSGREEQAALLVLADGGANATKIPGIGFREKDYAQVAVVAALRSDRAHGGRAYERFTPHGPVALLPVDDRYGLVWTASPREAERLLALGDEAFLDELQAYFGDRAGRFVAVQNRASFPLMLRAVNSPVALRTAIVGNAAQALHPIAGQGLNLGLRDAAALAGEVSRANASVGSAAMLDAYRAARTRDAARGIAFTDILVSVFTDSRRLPTWGRGLGLAALDLFPPARRLLADRMIRGAPTS